MISYLREGTKFNFSKRRICTNWIKAVIHDECTNFSNDETKDRRFTAGDITIVFCSDEYLLEINKKFLSHDFFTDVITFDYSNKKTISGDIFISIETVRDNSSFYKKDFSNELHRVIIHGVLHLLGYKDRTKTQKLLMRERENFYLKKLFND
ncbi:MAG: rRNA maturation RNase YbeY [Bacteroidetes bacterium GWF2_40_14]|nr:MAG: rRNA maturation RNase YbeY [Bacteroidetes bacterium GWF2_40_14]